MWGWLCLLPVHQQDSGLRMASHHCQIWLEVAVLILRVWRVWHLLYQLVLGAENDVSPSLLTSVDTG